MKAKPKLVRVLTPPPVGPTNLLYGPTQQSVSAKALALHLYKSVPTAAPRVSPFRTILATLHPSQPIIAYLLIPDGNDRKKFAKTIVVQHVKTKAIMWSMSLGELASRLFTYDVVVKGNADAASAKQARALKELGKVQFLEFFDQSTLYWDGNGAISGPQDEGKRWSYLIIQLQNRVVMVNLRQHSAVISKTVKSQSSKTTSAIFKQILAHITQDSLGSLMSSNVVPVNQENMLVGTTDGSLKLYNWKANVVVQSSKVSTIKNDSIVHVIPTNKYGTPEYYASSQRRVVCLTKKGSAFLVELKVTEGIVHDIAAPIAKFEGGSVPTSMSKQDDDHSSMEHILVQYCAFRNLLLWTHPSKSGKARLMVWDFGHIPEPDAKQKRKGEPPLVDPLLVMQFPYEVSHTIFPGWVNEAIPMESMACAAVTKEGDFQILVAPLYNSGSTMKNPYAAVPILSVNLNEVVQRDLELPEDWESHMKVTMIACPPLRDSSIFYIGTNFGLLAVKMVDGNLVPVPGTRHAHLSANLGSLGKAILTVKGPEITYGALESSGGPLVVNPIGMMESKNSLVIYESPPPLHLPPEIHKRPVRLPPLFLMSPSRSFLCCFWKEEMRYEVLHLATMLERVTSRTQTTKSPVVASGNGVASFAWISDDDVFGLLYNPEQDLALKVGIDLTAQAQSLGKEFGDLSKLTDLKKLKDIASLNRMKGGARAMVGTAAKLQSLKGIQELGKKATLGTVKSVTKVSLGTLKVTGKVALGTTKAAVAATTNVTAGAVKGTTKLAVGGTKLAVGGTSKVMAGTTNVLGGAMKAATFGLVGGKKKAKDQGGGSLATADDDEEEVGVATHQQPLDAIGEGMKVDDDKLPSQQLERNFPWVELRSLAGGAGTDGNVSNATPSNLGELMLRSGNRNPPTVLFGGPVLCVASKLDEHDEGLAYFYTKKPGSTEEQSGEYVSSGPAFPCPDIVEWDEDGRLCAVVIESRVSIYLSDEPEFIMLGTVRLGTPSDVDIQVTSARFLHGVLFCTTRSAVQCIFLGDLDGGVCHLDIFTLACSDVPVLPTRTIASDYKSLTPPTMPMPLSSPTVLGFQNGALVISTVSGVQAIPLGFPLVRIGTLVGAGLLQKAENWFDAVPTGDHEALSTFLERRGVPDLALKLSGVSLETTVDLCMRYGFVDRLEEVVETVGVKALRAIDMSRGVSTSMFGPEDHGTSVTVCVGAYLLCHGKVELVRRLATECLRCGAGGKQEAFMLASLLLSVDAADSKRLIHRAVQLEEGSDWLVGSFVNDHVLQPR